jgi:hypothetical protein
MLLRALELIGAALFGWFIAPGTPPDWWSVPAASIALAPTVAGLVLSQRERIAQISAPMRAIMRSSQFDVSADVRCTFHTPVARGNKFRQAVDYVPTGTGKGRSFPIDRGIVGRAFRELGTFTENFSSDEEFRHKMVTVYRWTQQEAAQRTVDRRSYLCIPVSDEDGCLLGVVFFDAAVEGTFPSSGSVSRAVLIESLVREIRDLMIG